MFLVVFLPAFRLERCGFLASDVAALTAEEKGAVRLVALTPAARLAGLSRGTTATEARALVPEIALVPWEPEGEAEDRRALHQAFLAVSDRVAVAWDDALVADVSWLAAGTSAGGRGEDVETLVGRAVRIAESLGHACQVAVASDPLAALALAEWTSGGVVTDGAAALAPLPVVSLRPDDELMGHLRAIGVETVGQLAALDAASVRGRYGDDAARLHRVARGQSGRRVAIAWGIEDGDHPTVTAPLPGATSVGELRFVVPGLVAQLAARLGARDLAVVRLRIVLHLEERTGIPGQTAVTVRVGRPTRSPRLLERLVSDRLTRVRVPAPIDELALEVEESVFDRGWQPGLTDRAEATEPLPDLVARMADQLGDAALFRAVLADRWRPEGAWSPAPFPPPTLVEASPDPVRRALASDDPVEIQAAWEVEAPFRRPTVLLPKRLPVAVVCEDGAPVRVELEGVWCPVRRVEGPERLFGEWWEDDGGFDRSYWSLAFDGGREAWIVCEHERWSLHGWFD